MKIGDIEQFIKGCEEIDRKRKVITRIIFTIEYLLRLSIRQIKDFRFREVIFRIEIDDDIYIDFCAGKKEKVEHRISLYISFLEKKGVALKLVLRVGGQTRQNQFLQIMW